MTSGSKPGSAGKPWASHLPLQTSVQYGQTGWLMPPLTCPQTPTANPSWRQEEDPSRAMFSWDVGMAQWKWLCLSHQQREAAVSGSRDPRAADTGKKPYS